MLKTIKIIFFILIALIVILSIGLFIFIKTLDINQFKEKITLEMSKSIDREVSIGHLSFKFSLAKGVVLNLSGLSVMDHPDFATTSMLYIDSTHLNVDILSFIQRKQILVSNVELNSIKVNVVKNKLGEINFEKIAEQGGADKEDELNKDSKLSQDDADSAIRKNQKANTDLTFGDMLIRSITISDGTIIYTDESQSNSISIPINKIDLKISNLSFKAAFPVNVKASLWNEDQNIEVKGLVQINPKNKQTRIDDLKIETDLSKLSIDQIHQSIPSIKSIGLKDRLGGRLVINGHQMVVSSEGLLVLSSEGRLTDGKLVMEQLPIPIEQVSMHFELSESNLKINEMTMPIGNGSANMSGRVVEYSGEQTFIGDIVMNNVPLNKILEEVEMPFKIEGKLNGDFKGEGKGFDQEAINTTLVADGKIDINEGRVLDINVLKLVLSKLSYIPNLLGKIEGNLPDRYKEKLKEKDTILEKVNIEMHMRGENMNIKHIELNADGFLIIAQGKLDLDQNLSLNADFYIPEDLSGSLVTVSQELGYLLDDQKRIHIPFKPYSGKLADFRMFPDVKDVGKAAIQNKGKEELRKVLFKALDLHEEPVEPVVEESTPEELQPTEQNTSPEDAIIENILDLIPNF